MSFYAYVGCVEGAAVSCDSRASGTLLTEPLPIHGVPLPEMRLVPVADSYEKIRVIAEKYLVGWLGIGRDGIPPSMALRELEMAELADPSPTSTAFLDRVKAACRGVEARPVIAWSDAQRTHMCAVEKDGAVTEQPLGIWPLGFGDDVVRRLITDPRLDKTIIPAAIFSIEAAANLSRFLVQTVIDLQSFELHGRPVGGLVQTAIAPVGQPARMVVPRRVELRDYGITADPEPLTVEGNGLKPSTRSTGATMRGGALSGVGLR